MKAAPNGYNRSLHNNTGKLWGSCREVFFFASGLSRSATTNRSVGHRRCRPWCAAENAGGGGGGGGGPFRRAPAPAASGRCCSHPAVGGCARGHRPARAPPPQGGRGGTQPCGLFPDSIPMDLRCTSSGGAGADADDDAAPATDGLGKRYFLQFWTLGKGPEKSPPKVPKLSKRPLRVAPAARGALVDPSYPCRRLFRPFVDICQPLKLTSVPT